MILTPFSILVFLLGIPAKEFQFEGLHKGLKLLSEFERGANARVVDSGLLKGINVEDIKKAGERLILQDGCRNFFQNLVNLKQERDLDVHILSYCWCADLIRSAFSSGTFVPRVKFLYWYRSGWFRLSIFLLKSLLQ